MHREPNESPPRPCAQCGKSGTHGSTAWGHNAYCCSNECGMAYRDSSKRARTEAEAAQTRVEHAKADYDHWINLAARRTREGK